MTTKTDPKKDEQDAIRVEFFRTQAVGIVGPIPGETLGPANGETFLALKSAMDGQQDPQAGAPADATKSPPAPPAAPPAAALKMPASAKASMTEALSAVIDGCAKMAEALQAAEIDDTAPVPMELVQMAADVEDKLGAMVEPYEEALMAAAPPPAPPAEGEPAQKSADAPAAPEQKPRPRLAMKRIMAMEGVSKSIAEGAQKIGELVAWAKGAAGAPPPAVAGKGLAAAQKAELDPFTAMSATLAAVRERMWAASELISKDPAKAISELREVAGMLDKAAILATGGGGAPPPAPPPPAVPAMTEEAVQKAVAAGVASAKGDLLASIKAEFGGLVLTAKSAAAQAQAALAKVEKSVPAPNAQPAGENPTPLADTPPPADPWRQATQEIQETSQARRKSQAGK